MRGENGTKNQAPNNPGLKLNILSDNYILSSFSGKVKQNLIFMGVRMSFLEMRKRAKLTQDSVAEFLHVTGASVCQWEKGITLPRATLLPQIAKLYSCTVDELLRDNPGQEQSAGRQQ